MESAEQFSTERRDLLLELSLLIAEQRGVDAAYAAFASQTRHGATFDFTSLFAVLPDPAYVRSVGHYPGVTTAIAPGEIRRSSDIGVDQVAQYPDGIEFIPRKLPLPSATVLASEGFERAWVTPLIDGEQNYGVLTVAKRAPGAFPGEHIAFLRAAARLLARAVKQEADLTRARTAAARAFAASDIVVAIQAGEPFESIFQRLPGLLTGALETDYIGLVIDRGDGFVMGGESPAGIHPLEPSDAAGTAVILELARGRDFLQVKPQGRWSRELVGAGYGRLALSFLRDGEALRGVLIFGRRESRRFNEDERMFIEFLRSMLTGSLASQHRLDRSEAAAARAGALNDVALLLNAGEELEAVVQQLLELLERAVDLDYVALMVSGDGPYDVRLAGQQPVILHREGVHSVRTLGFPHLIQSGEGVLQVLIDEVPDSEAKSTLGAAGYQRLAVLVISDGGETEGFLALARRSELAFTGEDIDFLTTLCALLGQAIAAQRRLKRVQAEAARSQLLNELAVLLNEGQPAEAFFASLSEHLRAVVPFDALTLFLEQGDGFVVANSLRSRTLHPGEWLPRSFFGEETWRDIEHGKLVREGGIGAFDSEIGRRVSTKGVIRGAVAAIQHDSRTVGFLTIGRDTDTPFEREGLEFLELLCVLLGQTIANRKKAEETRAEGVRNQVISELTLALQSGDRVADHFSRLSELALQAVGFDFISVTTRSTRGEGYTAVRSHELFDAEGRALPEFDPAGIQVIRNAGRVISAYRTSPDAREVPAALYRQGFIRAVTAIVQSPEGDEGLLTVGRRADTRFSPAELRFIGLVAALIGQANDNYSKANERKAEALRNSVLRELAVLLNNGEPLEAHFNSLRELLQEGVGFDFCAVAVRTPLGGYQTMRSHPLLDADGNDEPPLRGAAEAILGQRATSLQYGRDAVSLGAPGALFRAGLARAASFVLSAGDGPEGVFTVGRLEDLPFTPEEMAFFEVVATLLGQAAANARRLVMASAEAREQAIIAAAAAAVASETGIIDIVRALRHAVGSFIPQPFVNFGYVDGDDEVSFPAREGGVRTLRIGPRFRQALEDGWARMPRPEFVNDEYMDEPIRVGLQEHAIARAMSAGAVVGLLVIGSYDGEFVAGETEVRLARLIADIVGPAMANARAVQREREEAEEQRVLTEVAAAAAREAVPGKLVAALQQPFASLIPKPLVAFGFKHDGEVHYPRPDGTIFRLPMNDHLRLAEERGQVFQRGLPDDLPADGPLKRADVQAISLTAVQSAGVTVGFLMVGSLEPGYKFSRRDTRLFRLIAQIVGPAMENARAAVRSQQEAEDQHILAEAAAAVARASDEASLARGLRGPIQAFAPRSRVMLFYHEGDGVRVFGTQERYEMGPQTARCLAGEQVVGDILNDEVLARPRKALGDQGVRAFVDTPIISGGETLGVLFVGATVDGHRFSARDLRLMSLIAGFAGPAMANQLEASRREREAREQRILAEAAAAVASARDERELILNLRAPLREFIPGALAYLGYVQGEELVFLGSPAKFLIGAIGEAALRGQTVVDVDDPSLSEITRARLRDHRIGSLVLTATVSGGETLGLFQVATQAEYTFSEDDLRLLRLIAGFVGPTMANLRESARRERDAREQRILAEAAAAVASARDEAALARGLRGPIQAFLPGSRVMLFTDEGDHFRVVGTSQCFEHGPQNIRALTGEQFTNRVGDDEILPEALGRLRSIGVQVFTDTPVIASGDVLGVLFAGMTGDYSFSEDDLRLLRLIAGFVGPALANLLESARRAEEAEEQRILAEAAAGIAAGRTETEILNGLVGPLRQIIPGAVVAFSYIEGDEMVLWDGRNRRPIVEHSRLALEQGQAIGVSGETETGPTTHAMLERDRVRQWVNTVALSGGVPVGLMFVGTRSEGTIFTGRVLRIMRLIAGMAGPAMLNAGELARRAREAEDERVLAEVAALAARATTSEEILDSLGAALEGVIPGALALYGFFHDEFITYEVTLPSHRELIGASEFTIPLSPVGVMARATGQGSGTLADVPSDRPYLSLGLQAYTITTYASPGAPLGGLLVSTSDPAYSFDPATLVLLRRIVQVVGPAIEGHRAAVERARQSELYGLILRSLSEGVVLADNTGRVVFANEQGREHPSRIDSEGKARGYLDFVEMLPEEVRPGYRAVFEQGQGSRGRMRLGSGDGATWLDYEFVPLKDPVLKVLFVGADVTADVLRETEQERNREQLEQSQRLAALGELIGGVAHELNNPLTAILGFAEVMSLSPEAAPLAEELGIVQKEALRARNIVRDLLLIARPGTSERASIPVAELFAHIERLRRTAWIQQGIRWEINIEEPCQAWGNEHQLTQVILNLVTNAEHALAAAPEKRISVRASSRDGITGISVTDTGSGMDEATRNRVFEPFFTTKQGQGTGLGLSLSRSIIQSHEGTLRLDSTPGVGTTFTVILPASADAGQSTHADAARAAPETTRVLVIDDEPSLRKVCQRLITSLGHECATAENSATALEFAANGDFDLVLCDYRLATETADAVIAGFERIAPQLIPRTVIATGATTDSGVLELTRRHNLRLMAKPYGIEELTAIISRAG